MLGAGRASTLRPQQLGRGSMKDYHTISSLAGLRLPHAGILLGRVANALQIKSEAFPTEALQRQARRYFKGDRVEPEGVDEIIGQLVMATVPDAIPLPAVAQQDTNLQAFLKDLVPTWARKWDAIAADVNFSLYPVSEFRDLPIPPLRLFLLEVGLRVGAWLAVQELHGKKPSLDFIWQKTRPFAELVLQWQKRRGLAVEDAAAELGVSPQTMSSWRNGQSEPEHDKLPGLAVHLRPGVEPWEVADFHLRVVVAVQILRKSLDTLCGHERIQDMVDAAAETAKYTYAFFIVPLHAPQPETLDIERLIKHRRMQAEGPAALMPQAWNVVLYGCVAPVAEPLCLFMAQIAKFRDEVAYDFHALRGHWPERIQYWMHELGAHPHRADYLHRNPVGEFTHSPNDAKRIADAILQGGMRMAGFDWRPSPDWHWAVVPLPPHGKAMNRLQQANRESSVGNIEGAVEHLTHAVKHQPEDACLHFYLGCQLWQLGFKKHFAGLVDQGLLEIRLAIHIDPEFGNARNELAILLSNMRRHGEAEAAFQEAEPHHGDHAHHWFSRANNYLALGRYDNARMAFERAIALTKDGANVLAMARLAATFVKLERKGDARRLGQKVFHLIGKDPTEHWEEVLDVWGDRRK